MTLSRLEQDWLKKEAHSESELQSFTQRANIGEPIAKIIGHKGFWKHEFVVSHDVLDPRPDSETLIEAVLECYPNKQIPLRILDLGTGSGCLIISLIDEYKNAHGIGVDISKKALSIARKNAKELPIDFVHADMKSLPTNIGLFDIIISNPPYIPSSEIENLESSVKNYDPHIALDGGKDGLDFYRSLSHLNLAPIMFVEIGKDQQNSVIQIMKTENWIHKKSWKDLGGVTRILAFEKKSVIR